MNSNPLHTIYLDMEWLLETLNLSHCGIENLNNIQIEVRICKLVLQNNEIKSIADCNWAFAVEKIDLSHNYHYANWHKSGTFYIQFLNLSHNK